MRLNIIIFLNNIYMELGCWHSSGMGGCLHPAFNSYTGRKPTYHISSIKQEEPIVNEKPPEYEEIELSEEFTILLNLKDNQRLRQVNNKIELETRSSLQRTMSKDSRYILYEDLERISKNIKTNSEKSAFRHAVNTLINTTYKSDKKWIEMVEKLLGIKK